jgi:hypothetical protein
VAVLIVSYLLLVLALPIALSAIVSYRALPRGRNCPHCRTRTVPLVSRPLRVAARVRPRAGLQRRWCMECGWEGTSRIGERPAQRIVFNRARSAQAAKVVRRSTQTLDVRSLDVDGAAWRVMLQCWGNTGVFYGRLLFLAPSGRLWLDAVESFSGSNQSDVLGQALSLPEGLLESRLRRLVTDN